MQTPINILTVDDRPENLLALEGLLDKPGRNIHKAASGNEALGMMLKDDFALVLLDVQMPEMDGFETAELMRANVKTSQTPIIFVTAINKDKEHQFKGYEAGAVDYLFKPIDPTILTTKVDIFCDLYRAKSQAEADRKFLETTLKSIGDGVIATDTDGIITFINPQAEEITGCSTANCLGQKLATVFQAKDKEGEIITDLLSPTTNSDGLQNHKDEIYLILENDTTIPLEYSAAPIIDNKGKIHGTIVIFHDIRHRKEEDAERATLRSQLRQAQKMEAIGTLAGGIAHDFNNILTPIVGYSELTMAQMDKDSEFYHNLEELHKAAYRARDLVKQILTFSRQKERQLTPLRIQPVVKEALKLLRSTLPSTIKINQRIDPAAPPVLADPTQIHQIVMNICTNAFHAIPEQGGILDITLEQISLAENEHPYKTNLPAGGYLKLSIGDNGCGMDKITLDRIFDPYFTTKEVGKGTGMGLAVVHGITLSHHGQITVESEVGTGTTFHVFLPASSMETTNYSAPQSASLPRGNGRILLVDDEEQIINMTEKMLNKLGYETVTFTSSTKALAAFTKDPDSFDIMITDQTMPEITGENLARATLTIRPALPVILCTGYSEIFSKEQATKLGIKRYLRKPIAMAELANAIHEIMPMGKEQK